MHKRKIDVPEMHIQNQRGGVVKRIGRYLNHLRNGSGVVESTVAAHKRWLTRWLSFTDERELEVWEATEDDVLDFIGILKEREYGPDWINHGLAVLRGFYQWGIRQGLAAKNPCADVKSLKIIRKVPRVPSVSEIEKIIDAADVTGPTGIRNRALMEILYSTGCRVSEIIDMDLRDLDVHKGQVVVTGKGGKERVVAVNGNARAALLRYLKAARGLLGEENSPPLFYGIHGTRLSRAIVQDIIRVAARRGGVYMRVTPHTMRHAFATHLLDAGMDIRYVQELLGHALLSTTQIYTQVSKGKLMSEYAKYHPRASAT